MLSLSPLMCARRRSAAQGSAGFTLIEILCVLVIMCILAAIILPRYIGGKDPKTGKRIPAPRERAQRVAGVEYIGQINQAIMMYKNDHDEQMPQSLQELKAYGLTDEMLLDPVTRQPLSYDPRTGRIGNSAGTSQGPYSLGGGQTLPQVGSQ
jgi:prepilin-type N-terminal cleavage/methylation domain-containing protein